MYWKLAIQNIRRSLRDYIIYFVTLTLTAALMYSFLALGFSSDVLAMAENMSMLTTGILLMSALVAFMSSFVIGYAIRFMLGRRKKEFATWVNPKFCVNAKLWCKIEQKYFKAGAAQAAAAFSTKITALRGDVKGRGVSLRSSRLLTFRLQPVSPACGRQRTPLTVRELRSSPAAFRSTSS